MVDRSQVRVGPVAGHEPIFPLDDHAQMLIVQQQHFDRQILAVAGGQFLDIHLKTAVAIDIDDQGVRMGGLGAHRGGQTESHRSQPGTGQPACEAD